MACNALPLKVAALQGAHHMAEKVIAQMETIREALLAGYAGLATIRRELDDWLNCMGPRWRPDNTSCRFFISSICDDLEIIEAPDLTFIPEAVLAREVCVVLCVSSKSCETRRQNSLARLRPPVAALRKVGLDSVVEKIDHDIKRVDWTFRIRGAYE